MDTLDAIARARGYAPVDAIDASGDPGSHRLFCHAGGTVLVVIDEKLTMSATKACVARAEQASAERLIVVLASSPTSTARAALLELAGRPVELFTTAELSFDIMTHELVPTFEVLAPEEIPALLHRFRIKLAQLPRMQCTDPCARYLGLARGQVVRVRRAGSGVESTGYRIVT